MKTALFMTSSLMLAFQVLLKWSKEEENNKQLKNY
jgi:hypothetical protein